MSRKLEDLKAEYERKRHELEEEEKLTSTLPLLPDSFCGATWKAPYISYRPDGMRHGYSIEKALEIVDQYKPYLQTFEVRKAGCVSISPPAIQSEEYKTGELKAEGNLLLTLEGGDGYQTTKLVFWALVQGKHFHVSIDVARHLDWKAYKTAETDWRDKPTGRYITHAPKAEGAKHQINYGGCFERSYHVVHVFDLSTFEGVYRA